MPVCAPTRSPPGRALHSARWHGRTPGGKLYIWSSVTCPSERARSANLGRAWRVLFRRFDWPCLSTPRPSYIPCLDATFGFRTEPLYYIHPSNVLLQDRTCVTKCPLRRFAPVSPNAVAPTLIPGANAEAIKVDNTAVRKHGSWCP